MRREVRVKGCMNKKYISTEIYFLFNKDYYTNYSQQVDSSILVEPLWILFYWSIVDLQCVNFCCTEKSDLVTHTHIYVCAYSFSYSFEFCLMEFPYIACIWNTFISKLYAF